MTTMPTPEATPQLQEAGLLRLLTCGSVDDGKSTLLGRLLYDSKAILADALDALSRSSQRRGLGGRGLEGIDLSLLTDGLSAEREQGITIDVAYRFFRSDRRTFILADTPGHEQYTRNMVTGASTADLAVILVDARRGILDQTRRHTALVGLLRIPTLVVAVNKMDLVGYDEATFTRLRGELEVLAAQAGVAFAHIVPLSALQGDMVVARGERLGWYEGPTLLEILETAPAIAGAAEGPFRFPVQGVCRPRSAQHPDFRGYQGRVESGRIRLGDRVDVSASGLGSRVDRILLGDQELPEAVAGQSLTLCLADDLDLGRGDLLADPEAPPTRAESLEATLVWFDEAPLRGDRPYLLRHGASEVRAQVQTLHHRLDIRTFEAQPAPTLGLNDIARATLRLQQPLAVDAYGENRATGAFILVDPDSHHTVAAGLVLG